MRTALALAALLSIVATADARPHRRQHQRESKAVQDRYIATCVSERTGPVGGLPVREALTLCTSIARHDAKIARLAERAAAAIEACELEVSIACEDTTERAEDHGECSDDTLRARHAFDVCTGHGPAFASKEAK